MTDLKEATKSRPVIVHEDDEAEFASKIGEGPRWRITVTENDEPVTDRENPPCRTVWETSYLGDDGVWHAGSPTWPTWLRLMAKVHQAGLVVGRRAGMDEAKVKAEKRGRPIAVRLRELDGVTLQEMSWATDLIREAANLLSPIVPWPKTEEPTSAE